MRTVFALLTLSLAGCSTAPLAGLLDRFYPGGVPARAFERGKDSGIRVGPPKPVDPLVESPGLAIPNTPAPRGATPEGSVIPPPTLSKNSSNDLGRTASLRAGEAPK